MNTENEKCANTPNESYTEINLDLFENNYIFTSVCKILAVNSLGSLLNISVFLQSKAISCMNQVAW